MVALLLFRPQASEIRSNDQNAFYVGQPLLKFDRYSSFRWRKASTTRSPWTAGQALPTQNSEEPKNFLKFTRNDKCAMQR